MTAPDFNPSKIIEIATQLAGAYSMRTMLFKNHSLSGDPQKMAKELIAEATEFLKEVDDGERDLVGITDTGDTQIPVGRGTDPIFT